MRVSVLMPVYNKAPFVKEAIDSVLNGSFQDFEICLLYTSPSPRD